MTGKNILILGASSGIGYCTAEHMAKQGDRLFLAARRRDRLIQLQQAHEQVRQIWDYDLREEKNIEKIFADLRQNNVKLDGMVYWPLRSYEEGSFLPMFDINFKSFLAAVKYFSSKRYSNDGSVITAISSISNIKPRKGRIEYTATKGALAAIVPSIALELLDRKIRVNAISPSFVRTELYEAQKEYFDVDAYIAEHQPWGLIEPEEIAEIIIFLHSDCAKKITGQNLIIDAGETLI